MKENSKRRRSLETYSGILLEFQKGSETEVIILPSKCLCGQAEKTDKKKVPKEYKSRGGEKNEKIGGPQHNDGVAKWCSLDGSIFKTQTK